VAAAICGVKGAVLHSVQRLLLYLQRPTVLLLLVVVVVLLLRAVGRSMVLLQAVVVLAAAVLRRGQRGCCCNVWLVWFLRLYAQARSQRSCAPWAEMRLQW